MGEIFSLKSYNFYRTVPSGKEYTWQMASLDATAKVVCVPCNTGWMSKLEQQSKPILKNMLIYDKKVSLFPSGLRTIAAFVFKTAVIVDHMAHPARNPFFTSVARHRFAKYREIPSGVQMWIAAFNRCDMGNFTAAYSDTPPETENGIDMYSLTFTAGYLVFQMVAVRSLDVRLRGLFVPFIIPPHPLEKIAKPFWPKDVARLRWPPVLRLTPQTIGDFATLWTTERLNFTQ